MTIYLISLKFLDWFLQPFYIYRNILEFLANDFSYILSGIIIISKLLFSSHLIEILFIFPFKNFMLEGKFTLISSKLHLQRSYFVSFL